MIVAAPGLLIASGGMVPPCLARSINIVLCNVVNDLHVIDLPGDACLMLADGVSYLDPASAVFEAMLEEWATQQRARFLKDNTIGPRVKLVRRFASFTNQYPWQWEPAEAEVFITRSRYLRPGTIRTPCGYSVLMRPMSGTDERLSVWSSSAWYRGRSWTSGTRSRM
jgi:hypothetical protein